MNSKGSGLIQVLATLAISLIIMVGLFSVIDSIRSETRSLEEKLAVLSLESTLIRTLHDLNTCSNILRTPTPWVFNSSLVGGSSPPVLNLSSIPSTSNPGAPALISVGTSASPTVRNLIISSIQLQGISGSGDNYTGQFVVSFDNSRLVRSIKHLSVQIRFSTDPTTPATAKRVVGCQSSTGEMSIGGLFQYYPQCGNRNGTCVNANASWTCGENPFSAFCNNACRHPNPLTGQCTCPAGYSESNYFDFVMVCGGAGPPFYTDSTTPLPPAGNCGVIGIICTL
jgi:hypothetical protein